MQVAGFAAETDTESQRDSWSLAKIDSNHRRNCRVEGGSQKLQAKSQVLLAKRVSQILQ